MVIEHRLNKNRLSVLILFFTVNICKMKNKRTKSRNISDSEYPGYPKYPAKEDIMNRGERVLLDDNAKPIEGAESLDVENGVPPENIANDVTTPVNADPLDPESTNDEELGKRIYP